MDEKQIKVKLQNLIDEFKEHYYQHKKELEANTETKLIEPLFELLGWTKKDFVKQEKAHRGEISSFTFSNDTNKEYCVKRKDFM